MHACAYPQMQLTCITRLQAVPQGSPTARDALKVAACGGHQSERVYALRMRSRQLESDHGSHAVSHDMRMLPTDVLLPHSMTM